MFFPRLPLGSACRALLIAAAIAAGGRGAAAHEGPPFPILVDKPACEYVVSVWADPDIGEAQFFVIIDSPAGGLPPEAPQVAMWIEPASRRLERVTCEASRQALRNQMQFLATPYFDQRDMWDIGFQLTDPGGEVHELTTQIESTPPGYGPWDLAIYLFPFLLMGGLWMAAMARRRRTMQLQDESHSAERLNHV